MTGAPLTWLDVWKWALLGRDAMSGLSPQYASQQTSAEFMDSRPLGARIARRPAACFRQHQETRQRLVERSGFLEIEDVAGLGKHREAGRRNGFRNRLGWMQASSSSPVMMDAKVFIDVRCSGSDRHRNDGRSIPSLTPMYGPAVCCKWILPSWR